MHDRIEPPPRKQFIHRRRVRNVGHNQLEAVAFKVTLDIGALHRRVIKIIEVIDDRDARRFLQIEGVARRVAHQVINEVAADEPRAAGDEKIFHSGQWPVGSGQEPG